GVDARVQALGRLGIDVSLPHDASKRCLDVPGRTAKPIIEIEMPEGGVEVVAPQQVDYPPTEPDAFRVAGRTGEHARGFGELVNLLFLVLGGVILLRRRLLPRLRRLLFACRLSRCERDRRTDDRGCKSRGEDTHDRGGHGGPGGAVPKDRMNLKRTPTPE